MDTKSLVYSRNVVEFATVAKEYCAFLENSTSYTRKSFVAAAHKLLPLLYYKTSVLPDTEPILDDTNEKFVDEQLYENILGKLKNLLGMHDEYLEADDPRASETEGTIVASISEYLTDIFQDLKNFTILYQVGNIDVMNDALWECKSNFQEYWGIRLANAIKAMHLLQYSGIDLDEAEEDTGSNEPDTRNWFVSQRQKDFRNE